jgi:nodulation protein A
MRWITAWEKDISPETHEELATLLGTTFAGIDAPEAGLFSHKRSWAGARPELRVYGRCASGTVGAHVGMLRRYVRIGEVDQLVAEIGLVAVRSDLQRSRIGMEGAGPTLRALRSLDVPFAMGTCREEIVPFYLSLGAHRREGVRVRTLDNVEPWRLRTLELPTLIFPVNEGIEKWPAGDIIDRNGQEV